MVKLLQHPIRGNKDLVAGDYASVSAVLQYDNRNRKLRLRFVKLRNNRFVLSLLPIPYYMLDPTVLAYYLFQPQLGLSRGISTFQLEAGWSHLLLFISLRGAVPDSRVCLEPGGQPSEAAKSQGMLHGMVG